MSKFCRNCGVALEENANFCPSCGTTQENTIKRGSVAKRDIAVNVILTVITCGIYGLFWFVMLTNESNSIASETEKSASGGLAIIYTILTCGIYGIYWNYKMGKKLYSAGKIYGKDISDNSVLYIVLAILGLGIVNYCLMQSDLNRFANEN